MANNRYRFESEQTILSPFNPYFGQKIIVLSDGTSELVRDPLEWEGSENDAVVGLKHNQSLNGIANKSYMANDEDASRYWWVIADVNEIDNPMELDEIIGSELIVPDFNLFKLQQQTTQQ